MDLVVGSYDGKVHFYSNIEDNLDNKVSSIDDVYFNPRTNNFQDVNYGKRSAPALADLNNDSLPDMILGLYRGGLVYFRNESDPNIGVKEMTKVVRGVVYPNPSNGTFNVELSILGKYDYSVYNFLGKEIQNGTLTRSRSEINLSKESKGFYLLVLRNKDKVVFNHKLVLLD